MTRDVTSRGKEETLIDVNPWNLNHQLSYPIDALIEAGDTVRTTCRWHNDTGATVQFVPFASDERCFNFVMYYPRIRAPSFSYLSPI